MRAALRAERFCVFARAAWAALEARQGDCAASRQLYEDALRIDPANRGVWSSYEAMERAARRPAAADLIHARSRRAADLAASGLGGTAPLPAGLEQAARAAAAAAARAGKQPSLERTLREEYGDFGEAA